MVKSLTRGTIISTSFSLLMVIVSIGLHKETVLLFLAKNRDRFSDL